MRSLAFAAACAVLLLACDETDDPNDGCPAGTGAYEKTTDGWIDRWCARPDGTTHGPYDRTGPQGALAAHGARWTPPAHG